MFQFSGAGECLPSSLRVWHASYLCHAEAEGPQRLHPEVPARWSCANTVEIRSVTEPWTAPHRWLAAIEGCPLSAAWPQQLTNTDGNR